MSTTDNNDAIYATLVRGRVYYLGDREFLHGEEQEISENDREWLVKHAVDQVTVEDEGEFQVRAKFEFAVRPRGDKPSASTSSPRSRAR